MVTLAEEEERLTCGSFVLSSTKKTSSSSKTASFLIEMLTHSVSAEVNTSCVPGEIGVKSTMSVGQREIKYELVQVWQSAKPAYFLLCLQCLICLY